MKIEIQLDSDRVFSEVVTQLHAAMKRELESEITKVIKGEIASLIRQEAKPIIKEALATATMPKGGTFKEQIEHVMKSSRWGWGSDKPKLDELVNSILENEAKSIFEQIVKPKADELREVLKKFTVAHVLKDLV